jgi:DNA-binding transcriptional regulator GbsR (MarR family)
LTAPTAAALDNKQVERVELSHFVEEVGLMFEAVGLPRMAGRIFGWLLIANPPHQSMGELVEVLQASKGSISTMTRLLIQISLIERVSFPGQRRDYFQIKPHAWSQLSQQRMTQITAFRQLAERGLELLADQPLPLQQRLQEMRDMHAFLEREMPLLDQRWQQEQEQRRLTERLSVEQSHVSS